jgi:ATP-dependent Clp protease ATP-binding subunit ClpC
MFERFSPPARSVVARAQDEARSLDQGYIGTEHLLLAIMTAAPTSTAAEVLASLGETAERIRAEILAIVGPGEGAPPGHLNFTPRSKKVLELSLREALRMKSKEIAPEHLLLGLIREGEGLACQILATHGIDLRPLRDRLLLRGSAGLPLTSGVFDPRGRRLTAGAAKATERANRHAGAGLVGSQHYLLGLLDDEDSVAAKVLASLGIDKDAVVRRLAEVPIDGTSDEPADVAGARSTSLEVVGDVITVRLQAPDLAARLRPAFARLQTDVLQGTDLPRAEQVWRSVAPAVADVADALLLGEVDLSSPPTAP